MQRTTSIRRGVVAAVCTAAVLAGACSTPTRTQADERASEPQLQQPEMDGSYLTMGWNRLINVAQAGVVASIKEVGSVQWNSTDGREWVNPDPNQPARKYRDVKVRVEQVVFASSALPLAEGQDVTIRSLYAADDSDHIEEVEPGVRIPANKIDGELVAGSDAVLLLGVSPDFPTQTGKETVIQIVSGWQGNWTVRGDRAENVAPRRSMALQALISRFRDERAAGRQPTRDAADKASVTEPPAGPGPTTATTWPASSPVQPPPAPSLP